MSPSNNNRGIQETECPFNVGGHEADSRKPTLLESADCCLVTSKPANPHDIHLLEVCDGFLVPELDVCVEDTNNARVPIRTLEGFRQLWFVWCQKHDVGVIAQGDCILIAPHVVCREVYAHRLVRVYFVTFEDYLHALPVRKVVFFPVPGMSSQSGQDMILQGRNEVL